MNNLGVKEFALHFSAEPKSFSEDCIALISSMDFRYTNIEGQELESLRLSILKRIDEDKQIIGAKDRTEAWSKGWQENFDQFLANAIGDEHRSKIVKAFVRSGSNHYFADLYALARAELEQNNVNHVFGGDFCSYGQSEQFYSYRRDKNCGRNASLIWLKS